MTTTSFTTTTATRAIPTEVIVRRVPERVSTTASGRRLTVGPRSGRSECRRAAAAEPRFRDTGMLSSGVPRRRRPITPVGTVVLALVASAITVWLGAVSQFGAAGDGPGGTGAPAAVQPDTQLAVVRVQSGETLPALAARVAPDAPVTATVEQIRSLNKLPDEAVGAGQTLIAPVA